MKMQITHSVLRRAAMLAGAVALVGSASLAGATPAGASSLPFTGALCTAAENIHFYYPTVAHPSYTVQAGEFIRVDRYYADGGPMAWGHGEGHQSRWFYWRHSNGYSRVVNCH